MEAIAAWISALAGVGALLAAVWAGLTAKRLYDVESERDAIAAEERERVDAALVSAWVCTYFAHPDATTEAAQERTDGVLITNGGRTPIYSLRVKSSGRDGRSQADITQHVLPPGEYFIAETRDSYHWGFPEQVPYLSGRIRPITKVEKWRVTEVSFVDANGAAWCRDERGLLAKM